jgi:hypothetical protein
MKLGVAGLAMTAVLATGAFAATPKPMSVDESASFLIDSATTEQLWKENTPARVVKLYPSGKFRFVSEVGGGFTDNKTCVVSARAMLLPVVRLPVQGRKLVYAPVKAATAFDAAPNLTQAQCQALARTKLKDAIQSVTSALAAN